MTGGASPGGWLRAAPLLLVALIVASYAPTWDAEFVVWDDDDHIYENRHLIAEEGYWDAWRDWRDPAFYPVTFTTWYVEWRVSDGQPWLFHVDNVLLHIANALLLGALLRALGVSYGLAWAIAGVWALHPQQVASVAWLTERKNLLYALFYLGSMLVYARSLSREASAATRGWLLALVLALAALLSKATAVTLPIAIALTHWVCGARFDRRAVLRISAFFALSLFIGLIHVSREEVTPLLPFDTRMLVAARAAWFYVGKFLWPTELVAVYPRWDVETAPQWGAVAFGALALAGIPAAWQARRIPPIAWLGITMYAANIALVIGVIWFPFMGYTFVSDHLVYVAAVGLALVFGLAANAVLDSAQAPTPLRVTAVGGVWLLLALLTWQQTAAWENTEALWTRTIATNPDSRLARKNLGFWLLEQGRLDDAQRQFEATLQLHPGDVEALLNMGVLASEREEWATAIGYFERTLEAGAYPSDALNNLGIAAARTGDLEGAIAYYERSLEEDPESARTWMNLAAARAERGDLEAAIADYETSLRLNPDSAQTHYNLGVSLNGAGRIAEAAEHYARADELAPRDVDTLYNLGVAYMNLERNDEAADRFLAVLEVDAKHSDAAHNLGAVLLAERDLQAAESAFAVAHELAPTDPDTASALAMLLAHRGDEAGAARVLSTALAAHARNVRLASRLAWIRATADATTVRDPSEAIDLAERVVGLAGPRPPYLDTLAAALAAADRFVEAEAVASQSLAATPEEAPDRAERVRRRDLYAQRQKFRPPN